jgi:hypothetical protein
MPGHLRTTPKHLHVDWLLGEQGDRAAMRHHQAVADESRGGFDYEDRPAGNQARAALAPRRSQTSSPCCHVTWYLGACRAARPGICWRDLVAAALTRFPRSSVNLVEPLASFRRVRIKYNAGAQANQNEPPLTLCVITWLGVITKGASLCTKPLGARIRAFWCFR